MLALLDRWNIYEQHFLFSISKAYSFIYNDFSFNILFNYPTKNQHFFIIQSQKSYKNCLNNIFIISYTSQLQLLLKFLSIKGTIKGIEGLIFRLKFETL